MHSLPRLGPTRPTHRWIKDASVTGAERLADCPGLIDPSDIGKPTYFISHAWFVQSTIN